MAKSRWVVHLRAKEGLLLGGMLENTSSAFETREEARDFLAASRDNHTNEIEGYVYGPGTRVELHPGTDLWMRGARFGNVTEVTADRVVVVRVDGVRKLFRCSPHYIMCPR